MNTQETTTTQNNKKTGRQSKKTVQEQTNNVKAEIENKKADTNNVEMVTEEVIVENTNVDSKKKNTKTKSKNTTEATTNETTTNNSNVATTEDNTTTNNEEVEEVDATPKTIAEILNDLEACNDIAASVVQDLKNSSYIDKENRGKLFKLYKDFQKNAAQLNITYIQTLGEQNTTSEKNEGKSKDKPKRVVNKETAAVNKKKEAYPFFLQFIGKEDDELISWAEGLQAINGLVKSLKNDKNEFPPEIQVVEDGKVNNKAFKINSGKLRELFAHIETKMRERGELQNGDSLPDHITYNHIMKYLTYCFPPSKK